MKSFINKDQRGSLTVEAAIVLPIFICAVLTIGFFTKIVYTHEIIQHAITEAVNEMASSSYLYYTSGVQDIDNTVDSELEDKKQRSQEHLDSITDCYKELNDSIGELKSNSQNIYEGLGKGDIGGIVESIDGINSHGKNIKDNVEEVQSVIKDIAEDPKSEMISIAALIAKTGYDKGKTAIGNQLIGYYVSKRGLTDERLKRLNIEKLDFSKSSYFKGDEDIDVIVKYKVDIPLPIKFVSYIQIVQRATARAWMGGDDGYSGSDTDKDNSDAKDKVIKVYVSTKGSRYHRFGCYQIFKEIEALDLQDAKKMGLEPCEKCDPPFNSKMKYTVFKTSRSDDGKYHKEGCNHLFKEIKEMDLEDAVKEYTRCKTCKPPH